MEFDNQLSRDVSTQHRRKTHRRKRSISKLSLSESEYSISRRSSQLQDELTKIALLESSESKAKTDSSVYITCSELCSGTCSYLSSISLNSALFPFNGRSLEYFNIKPRIFKNLIDIGIFKTSWIQERALPVLLRNIYKTCSIQSQSGTGKTLTYVITMLSKVNCTKPHCQILCIEPNAELVFQTLSVVQMLSEGLNELKLCSLKNDTSISKMPTITEHIVIAESGRNLQNCIECGKLNLSKLVLVIFDEADLIITNNRHQVITINLNTKKECQLFYFSATFNLEHKLFLHSISDNFYEISVDRKEMFLSTILQYYIKCKPEQKFIVTKIIYRHMKSGFLFVFVENKHSALNLSKLFNDQGIPNMYVLEENDTDDKLLVYKAAQCWSRGVIISTDTWARGIDLNPNVVVNYDLPNNIQDTCSADVYLHRIGRTGRFGKIGLAISLVHNFSQELFFKRLELRYGVLTNIMYLDVEDLKIIENCTEPKY